MFINISGHVGKVISRDPGETKTMSNSNNGRSGSSFKVLYTGLLSINMFHVSFLCGSVGGTQL